LSLDVFTEGLGYVDFIQNPQLQSLASIIPDVLVQARAPSTNRSYGLAYKRWRLWAQQYPEIVPLPASHLHVLLYLVDIEQSASSFSTVNLAVCAIKWANSLAGLPSPTDHILVQEALQGFRRRLARPTVRKDPFLKVHIHQLITLVDRFSLVDVRNTVLIVVAYFALLRVSELRHIRACNILVHDNRIEIGIPSSKCDQLRAGDRVLIAKLGGTFCPVELFLLYLNLVNIDVFTLQYDDQYVFRRAIPAPPGFVLSKVSLPLTYTRIRDIVKAKASQLGLNESRFSTHSMRSGGATVAANSGVNERALQRHGRWAAATSKDRYILDDVNTQLQVTTLLG
jgi:integrase